MTNKALTLATATGNLDANEAKVRGGGDATRLADLGYRPELRRDFSALETFGVAFSIMSVTPLPLSLDR